MFEQARSLGRTLWPLVGTAYLIYLAIQAPPARYVGLIGLLMVTPLLVGWGVGSLFGVGPWADDVAEP
ncbi:MAG: hypothetical protein ACI8UR_002116 [Natronomonas sp.]|jgi:hypothetical protein|uniref:hypothetical protein n=1 Tax=Natronomonas sp. TaxID=2184060 RepID=UPI00398A451F